MYAISPCAILFVKGASYESPRFCVTDSAVSLFDAVHGGQGIIKGTVSVVGSPQLPVSRKVRLHRKTDGMLIREVWSNSAGGYVFKNIPIQEYYVTAFDHTGSFNATIRDSITPETMP
jgi:hypothetical protein